MLCNTASYNNLYMFKIKYFSENFKKGKSLPQIRFISLKVPTRIYNLRGTFELGHFWKTQSPTSPL